MKPITAALLFTLALSACGEKSSESAVSAPASTPASAPAATSSAPIEQPTAASEVVNTAASEAADDNVPIKAFTAFGNKEAWRAVVNGNQLMLEGEITGDKTLTVERSAYAKGVEFYGKDGGQDVNLNIRTGSCKDNNGNENEFTATLSYGDKSYRGCAVAGAIEHAPT